MPLTPKLTQYKYIGDTSKVYFIGKSNPSSFRHHVFYTEPHYIKERKEIRNAIIGYTDEQMANIKMSDIEGEPHVHVFTMPLNDMKCMSSIMMMPLIVEAESYCDLDDGTEMTNVYFYYKEEYPSAKNLMNSKNRYA
jgi:hypothetical protein